MRLNFPIEKLVATLDGITEITDITWDKIYYWKPFKLSDEWVSIILSLIPTTPTNEIYKTARIQIQLFWGNENVTKKSLVDLQNIVIQKLCFDECWGLKSYDWFTVMSTLESIWPYEWLDDKKRNNLFKDIIIQYTI